MLNDSINQCPHCGDTENGYRYIVTGKYTQSQGWGNDPFDADCDCGVGIDKHGACRCNNCNKTIHQR